MLFRVRLDGAPCTRVTLSARWLPSEDVVTTEVMTAQGLCLLPWRVGQSTVEVGVDTTGANEPEIFELQRGRAHPDRVIEVHLRTSSPTEVGAEMPGDVTTQGRQVPERSGIGLALPQSDVNALAVANVPGHKIR